MDESIASVGDATLFSILDGISGPWQVEVEKTDLDKTSVTSHHGAYRFAQMSFSFDNAPETFLRTTDIILSPAKTQFLLLYLGNIILFSRSPGNNIQYVKRVLSILRDAGATLKLKKSSFSADKIEYLGDDIPARRLEIATRTTETIKGLKA